MPLDLVQFVHNKTSDKVGTSGKQVTQCTLTFLHNIISIIFIFAKNSINHIVIISCNRTLNNILGFSLNGTFIEFTDFSKFRASDK